MASQHGLDRVRRVLDPFMMGLGTTAAACASLGLDFVGVELDRGCLGVAIERVEEALSSLPI